MRLPWWCLEVLYVHAVGDPWFVCVYNLLVDGLSVVTFVFCSVV